MRYRLCVARRRLRIASRARAATACATVKGFAGARVESSAPKRDVPVSPLKARSASVSDAGLSRMAVAPDARRRSRTPIARAGRRCSSSVVERSPSSPTCRWWRRSSPASHRDSARPVRMLDRAVLRVPHSSSGASDSP
jgi:hypothetical protein